MLEDSWPVSMKIALIVKMADNSFVVLRIIFQHANFAKNRGHMLTPKIGKSRLGPGRLVRPGPRGQSDRVSCSRSGTKGTRRSNRPPGAV
jgi:hypothetical protein